MGACDFSTIGVGKDVDEAFRAAVEDARYESGHGGYSGTIAEKGGFKLFTAPVRIDISKFTAWIASYDVTDGGGVPKKHRELVGRVAKTYEDKWGPAVALEVTGKKAKEYKERNGLKGTRKRVFLFIGLASE